MTALRIIIASAVALCATAVCSCGGNKTAKKPDDAIARVGKTWLTRTELNASLPGGLSHDDSVKYAQAFVRQWVENELINSVAAGEVDMSKIDRLVDQYRKDLIMWEYNQRMYNAHGAPDIPQDSLMAYYEQHKAEFLLDRPLVKGVYLKVADDAPTLPQLRKLYRSTKTDDVDKLEKSQLNGAVHYDYFRDRWVDWQQIENLIPYDYGTDADKFLRGNKFIDISQGGFTYLLDISDVLHTGQTMPFEAAQDAIRDRLVFQDRRKYNEQLRHELYDNSVESGLVEVY